MGWSEWDWSDKRLPPVRNALHLFPAAIAPDGTSDPAQGYSRPILWCRFDRLPFHVSPPCVQLGSRIARVERCSAALAPSRSCCLTGSGYHASSVRIVRLTPWFGFCAAPANPTLPRGSRYWWTSGESNPGPRRCMQLCVTGFLGRLAPPPPPRGNAWCSGPPFVYAAAWRGCGTSKSDRTNVRTLVLAFLF